MANLDDLMAIDRIDQDRMIDRINELPNQLRDAWTNIGQLRLPDSYAKVSSIVLLGMGGSAIGGDLVRTLVADELKVPMLVSRDYDVPAFVGPDTLVIGSSYSGGTEETLSAFQQARDKGAKLVAVTTGGMLEDIASKAGAPVLRFVYKAQPRAALGHSIVPILGILQKLGLIGDKSQEIDEAAQLMVSMRNEFAPAVPTTANGAKELAEALQGRLPIVYGEGILSEVARRWKGQFNENSKSWAFFEVLPELNHNAVVGYEYPSDLHSNVTVIFLTSDLVHPRVKVRVQVTQEILSDRGIAWREVPSRGRTPLAQMMSSVYMGDFTSYYLSILHGVDPSPVKVISFLKNRLAQMS